MISKAKILFYGMFRRPNKVLLAKVKKLNFLNKLMLLQVRRFKNYKDIPPTVSIFDWQESKRRAWNHYKLAGICLMMYIAFDIIQFFKYRRLMIAEKMYEERRKNNLPDHPLYDIFGKNPKFEEYEVDFVFNRLETHGVKEP